MSPNEYHDLALAAERAGDYAAAAEHYRSAAAASVGHSRRAGYQRAAERCAALLGDSQAAQGDPR